MRGQMLARLRVERLVISARQIALGAPDALQGPRTSPT